MHPMSINQGSKIGEKNQCPATQKPPVNGQYPGRFGDSQK